VLTTIALLVSPVLHKLPEVTDEVRVTKLPAHIEVEPLAVIVGLLGNAVIVTLVAEDNADEQLPTICLTL